MQHVLMLNEYEPTFIGIHLLNAIFTIILWNSWGWVKTLVPSEPQNSW
jgi:hypothetical protein